MSWREKFEIDNLDLKSDNEDEMEVEVKTKKKTRKPREPSQPKPRKQPQKRRAKEDDITEKHTAPEGFMGIPEDDAPMVRPTFDHKKAIQTPQGRLLLNKRKSMGEIDVDQVPQTQTLWERVLGNRFAPPDQGVFGNYPQFQPQNPTMFQPQPQSMYQAPPQQNEPVKKKGVWEALFG